MYLKVVAGELESNNGILTKIDPFSIDDQDFVSELKGDLLFTLSGSPSLLIQKYAGKYFTGYKDIDKEIYDAIATFHSCPGADNTSEKLSNDNENKLKKLLFILRKVIIKNFLFRGISLCNTSKDHLKSVLLSAVDKYSIQDLENIFSFDNITFDVLDNLNGLDNIEITGIIKILKEKVQTQFFPTCLSKENINNIIPNILFLEEGGSDKLEFIKSDYVLNTCHLTNGKGCMTDLLLLPNDAFQMIVSLLESMDYNLISFCFSGYKFYKKFFDRVRVLNKNLSNEEIKKIICRKGGDWVLFWIDKGLPIEMLYTTKMLGNPTYEQCMYIYDHITNDPNNLLELFSKNCNTIIFLYNLYNNITKDLDEILELYFSVNYAYAEWDCIKTIFDGVNNYEKFKIIMHRFDNIETKGGEFATLAFFCKYFKEDFLDWVDNKIDSKIDKLMFVNLDNIKFFYEKGICKNIDDFLEYKQIMSLDIELLKKISILYNSNDNDYGEWLNLLKKVCDSSYSKENKENIVSKIIELPLSVAEKYVKIYDAFDKSNSFDVQVIKEVMIMNILDAEDPEEIVRNIDIIFLESNLPIVSKIFQVFKYIYNKNEFENRITEKSSPYLRSFKNYENKLGVIYKDLMRVMIESGESSLKEYIQDIILSKQSLFDFESGKVLDDKLNGEVLSLMKKIGSLNTIINGDSLKSIEILENDGKIDYEIMKNYYDYLRKILLIKSNDSIYTFFLNLCKKIGYSSLEDIILDMEEKQRQANNNGLNCINSMKYGEIFHSSNNYFLKGISSKSFGEILNRGVTSTEYLGGGEGSDLGVSSNGTPFDTDGVIIRGKDVFNTAKSHGYGNIAIIINVDKPGFHNTDVGLQGYDSNIYEMFKNHGETINYYGIRTGVASTEFDAIIYTLKEIDLGELQKIKYLIAKNGFYLPVFDLDKNLLFTPEEYCILRQGLSFSDKYKGQYVKNCNGTYISSNQSDYINQGGEMFNSFINQQKKQEIINEKINNEELAKEVFDKIKDILKFELGIQCNQNKNLLGAELYDSGSTGRGTEIPSKDIDLDFTLLLNSQDYERLGEIQKIIHEKIGTIEFSDHSTVDGNGLQIKSLKNDLGKEYGYKEGIRFDLLILKKTKSYLYPSNIAMKDRLEKVEELFGKDSLDFIKQNVVIMKKLLKSQGVYKNIEGGMGGIGVENWIMQHHGNFVEALESFEEVAYGGKYKEGKTSLPFEKFKNHYFIWDSGQNFKDGENDNYILKMNETGYNGILNIIKRYRLEGLQGIEELLQNYKEVKVEYLK